MKLVKLLVVMSMVAMVSACAMKAPCNQAPRCEGMMKEYGGK